MVNESLSELRRQKKLNFQDESVIENSLEHSAYMDSELESEEIQKLIDALPDGYKTVFVLYVVEGYKHSEIAERSGLDLYLQLHQCQSAPLFLNFLQGFQ